MSIRSCTNNIYQEFLPLVKSGSLLLTCFPLAYYSLKLLPVIQKGYNQAGCQSLSQSFACASYSAAGIASSVMMCIAILGIFKAAKLATPNELSNIRNPSIIASGPSRPQPNAFFQSQQNGGFARYAEDDLQSTQRRPLRNYDPVQWSGGSQSI